MIKRNFLIVVLLFFFKILFVQCTEKEVKIRYIHYDSKNVSKFISPKKETKLKITNKKITKAEVKDLLKKTEYSYDGLPDNFDGDYDSYLIEIYKLNDKYEYSDRFNVLSEDVDEITLDEEKYNKIDESYSVDFIFFTNSAIKNIRKSKISKVKVNETILELNDKIEIYKYLEFLPNNEINPIFKEITKQDLTGTINLKKESFGEALSNITFKEYLKNIDEKSLNSCEIKNNDKEYNCYSDKSEDLIFEFNCKIKRNVNINIITPNGYVLDADSSNKFSLNLILDDFSIKGILESLINALKEYFKDLENKKIIIDSEFKPTYDLDCLSYEFNAIDEPIDPKKYTLTNTNSDTKTINNNDDINSVDIFNLTDNSTIDIEVGERCELLKTMIAEIEFKPLEGTEVNSKIKKDTYKILLNLKDSSPENLKKQIIDYFKSKKVEGYYIPEDFYEQFLNTDGFYIKGTHDHFELSINLNEKAKGTFLKPKGAPDPDLEYFKNYKEEDGKPINPPQYIPPVQEQKDTPKLDKNTQCCATCGGKCLKCSNCNKKDR